MNKLILLVFTLLLLLHCNHTNLHEQLNAEPKQKSTLNFSFPKQLGFINDYENILNEKQKNELIKIIKKNKTKIIIVTTSSIKPYNNIQKYSTDLGNTWELDRNSIIISVSKQNRMVGIATGINIEKTITDSICLSIINNEIIPQFKNEDYYTGLKNAIYSIINKLK